MARERKVTRTIISTVAKLEVVDLKEKVVTELQYEFAGKFKATKDLEKHIEKKNLLPGYKVLSVVSTEEVSTLYGMPEQMFLELATPVDADDTEAEIEAE